MASDGLFAPLRDAALSAGRLRTAVAYPLSASSLGAAVQARAPAISSRCWWGRARIARLLEESACRPAGWKSSTRPTTSWNRRGPRRRWRATAPWAC